MPRRLLALDLDGTLLRRDGTIDPRDEEAIHRALRDGVLVTLATGRVATGALPTAQLLGLDTPLVCADGGVVVDARTGAWIEKKTLPIDVADRVIAAHTRHGLAPFVLSHDAVHCDARGHAHVSYVQIWTNEITVHADVALADAWRTQDEVALTVGIGTEHGVDAALNSIDVTDGDGIEQLRFRVMRSETAWALLARPNGCTKAAALARVAERLGVAREDTAAVGDWYNDVSMLEWAGRSFAMGQAPEAVRRAASDTLEASAFTGGGVAEAIARWLDR